MTAISERKVECLVFGYIRMINIIDQIIPNSIMKLCAKFYNSMIMIIYLDHHSHEYPKICSAQLNGNEHRKFNIKSIIDPDAKSGINSKEFKGINNGGACYVNNFKIPSNILLVNNKLSDNVTYNAIFVCTATYTKICSAYIFDTDNLYLPNTNMNIYYWKLPSLLVQSMGANALYSNKYGLIEIGGYNEKCFTQLTFDNISDIDKWKWKQINNVERNRGYMATSFISDDQIICCGGYGARYFEYADIYDLNTNKWTQMSDLKQSTCRAGIYFHKLTNKCFVGGGKVRDTCGIKTFQCFDVIKNQWNLLADTNERHAANPIIWVEDKNTINIASSYCKTYEKMDLREGQWTVQDNFCNNWFGDTVKDRAFAVRLLKKSCYDY